ncbi:MAG: hypothetical protein IJ545_04035 [Alphaproteobacteria bacterium]|nr:hypothetical protein [Alphaproteobacteria bacterium]
MENTTGGDACPCGIIDGVYYIASPDLSQEYLVGSKGLTRVVNQLPSYIDGVWAEAGEPFKGHKVKYIFAYKGDDVYVIVYGK